MVNQCCKVSSWLSELWQSKVWLFDLWQQAAQVKASMRHSKRVEHFKALVMVWVACCLTTPTVAQRAPGYDISYDNQSACRQDSDCGGGGRLCLRLFDGCAQGVCGCPPGWTKNPKSDSCELVRLGGSECTQNNQCPQGMTCLNERCRCRQGSLSRDRTYCFKPFQRRLGEECTASSNQCLQNTGSGYTSDDVVCTMSGECRCDVGFKDDSGTCRKLILGESWCSSTYQCQGGAVCRQGTCVCPEGYEPTAKNSLCARSGARTELGVGAACDEVDELGYCAHGLVCHVCAGQTRSTCVEYIASYTGENRGRYTGAATSLHVPRLTALSLTAALISQLSIL